jgi:hypothetical protein
MNRDGYFSSMSWCNVLCAAAALILVGSPAHAVLTNKYTFNNNTPNDSGPGAANATIVDQTLISRYVGGAIDLSANNGALSGQNFSLPTTIGAYVDLPNGVFKTAVTTADPNAGDVTLEIWATPQQKHRGRKRRRRRGRTSLRAHGASDRAGRHSGSRVDACHK